MERSDSQLPAPSTAPGLETGPRAGLLVRVILVVGLLVLGWVAAALLRSALLEVGLHRDLVQLAQALTAGALGVGVVVWACRTLDRRSLASLSFSFRHPDWRTFAFGAAFWSGLAAIALAAGTLTGAFSLAVGAPTAMVLWWIPLQALLVLCYEAVPEELGFRGYVYSNLEERAAIWVAVLGQAVAFTVWAFALVTILQFVGAGSDWAISLDRTILFMTFGITLALLRIWTGSLWAAIGFHWAFQTVTQLLFLDRLELLRLGAGANGEMIGIFFWGFTIMLGGIVAMAAIVRRKRAAG